MKSEELDRIVKDYLEDPEYVFANYKALLKVVESDEPNLSEEQLRAGIMNCKFKAPDVIALQSILFPPLHFDILDITIGKGVFGMLYKGLFWLILIFVVSFLVDAIQEWKLDVNGIISIAVNLLTVSIIFRIHSRRYNTIEFIYHVLHSQGKI